MKRLIAILVLLCGSAAAEEHYVNLRQLGVGQTIANNANVHVQLNILNQQSGSAASFEAQTHSVRINVSGTYYLQANFALKQNTDAGSAVSAWIMRGPPGDMNNSVKLQGGQGDVGSVFIYPATGPIIEPIRHLSEGHQIWLCAQLNGHSGDDPEVYHNVNNCPKLVVRLVKPDDPDDPNLSALVLLRPRSLWAVETQFVTAP